MDVGAVGDYNLHRLANLIIDQYGSNKISGHLLRQSLWNINNNIYLYPMGFSVSIP